MHSPDGSVLSKCTRVFGKLVAAIHAVLQRMIRYHKPSIDPPNQPDGSARSNGGIGGISGIGKSSGADGVEVLSGIGRAVTSVKAGANRSPLVCKAVTRHGGGRIWRAP